MLVREAAALATTLLISNIEKSHMTESTACEIGVLTSSTVFNVMFFSFCAVASTVTTRREKSGDCGTLTTRKPASPSSGPRT